MAALLFWAKHKNNSDNDTYIVKEKEKNPQKWLWQKSEKIQQNDLSL